MQPQRKLQHSLFELHRFYEGTNKTYYACKINIYNYHYVTYHFIIPVHILIAFVD